MDCIFGIQRAALAPAVDFTTALTTKESTKIKYNSVQQIFATMVTTRMQQCAVHTWQRVREHLPLLMRQRRCRSVQSDPPDDARSGSRGARRERSWFFYGFGAIRGLRYDDTSILRQRTENRVIVEPTSETGIAEVIASLNDFGAGPAVVGEKDANSRVLWTVNPPDRTKVHSSLHGD